VFFLCVLSEMALRWKDITKRRDRTRGQGLSPRQLPDLDHSPIDRIQPGTRPLWRAAAEHVVVEGAELTMQLGGRFRQYSDPLDAAVTVEALSDGRFQFTGPMFGGSKADHIAVSRRCSLLVIGRGDPNRYAPAQLVVQPDGA
jgi:hypothetical protein